jgi:hypothetical protein
LPARQLGSRSCLVALVALKLAIFRKGYLPIVHPIDRIDNDFMVFILEHLYDSKLLGDSQNAMPVPFDEIISGLLD